MGAPSIEGGDALQWDSQIATRNSDVVLENVGEHEHAVSIRRQITGFSQKCRPVQQDLCFACPGWSNDEARLMRR
jgi:hypothetical protein